MCGAPWRCQLIQRSGHVSHPSCELSSTNFDSTATPQVVLPQWTDCYDFAQRVEMLGIGRIGSKKTKPRWTTEELGQSMVDVIMGKDSDAMKNKAQELARLCRNAGEGREIAAKFILEEMSGTDTVSVSS